MILHRLEITVSYTLNSQNNFELAPSSTLLFEVGMYVSSASEVYMMYYEDSGDIKIARIVISGSSATAYISVLDSISGPSS